MEDLKKVNEAINSGLFENAHLETDDGARVVDVLIPRFRPRFPVLFWGSRTFMIHAGIGLHATPIYRECGTYAVVPIPGVTDNGLGLEV